MNAIRPLVLVFLVAALPMSADQIIGTPSGSGDTYQWTNIQISSYDKILLRIRTPNEDTVVKSFNYGTALTFDLDELPGTAVPAGEYGWELRVVPVVSQQVQQDLASARASGNFQQQRQVMIDAGIYTPIIQSGTFRVVNGSIVSTSGTESDANDARFGEPSTDATASRKFEPGTEDVVVADDHIVQSSQCVGFDCVNGESFSFDTIRLKENNLRIHFDDTSTIAGYPANDWRIIVNDSANGGTSKFSIEDSTGVKTPMTIRAGAATNSIFVDSTGRVGFRTSTPVLDLHIATSNTPAIRLEQNNSGGFTAQTWDVAGNEANFFIRDVTGGSKLPFRIRPGAATSSIDIDADGNVGIGTASPDQQLDVEGGNIQLDIGSFILWDGSWGIIQQTATNNLEFVQGSSRMALTTGGSVGIGTTAPSSLLHVNGGDIRVSGGSFIDDGTTLNVPDYVFDDTYELMPIDELAKFIRHEKHLPNVPSASQIAAGGVNLSQFQMRLLEKIEELTLYTIQLKAEIEALKAQQ